MDGASSLSLFLSLFLSFSPNIVSSVQQRVQPHLHTTTHIKATKNSLYSSNNRCTVITTPYTTVHKLPECISVFVCTSVQPSLKSTGNKYPRPHFKQTTTQCCQQSRCTVNNHKILSTNPLHGKQPHNTVNKPVSW